MQTINKQTADPAAGDYTNKGVCFCFISQALVQYVGVFSQLLIIALISWDLVLTKTPSKYLLCYTLCMVYSTEVGRMIYKVWSAIMWWEHLRIIPPHLSFERIGLFLISEQPATVRARCSFLVPTHRRALTINLHLGFLCSHPENPRGREMLCTGHLHGTGIPGTEAAETGSTHVWLLIQLLDVGWHIPPKWEALPWRNYGQQENAALQSS